MSERTCGTCGFWGGHPERTAYAFCYAPKLIGPTWMETLYPAPGYPMGKVLDQSPRMPFDDGAQCGCWKQTKRPAL